MSSTAASPARQQFEARPPTTNRWLKYIGEEDETASAPSAPSSPTATIRKPAPSVSAVDLDRIERLLNQLEVRSLAVVNYGYAPRPKPRRFIEQNKLIVSMALFALWLTSLVLAFAYFRIGATFNQPTAAKPMVSVSPNSNAQQLATAFDQLAETLVAASQKLDRLEKSVKKSAKLSARPANPAPRDN